MLMLRKSLAFKCDKCGKTTKSGGLVSYPLQNVVTFAGVAMLNTDTTVNLCTECTEELCAVINKFIVEDFVGCK